MLILTAIVDTWIFINNYLSFGKFNKILEFNSNENQRLGNVKMYSNMFTNNYNFVKRNTEETESQIDTFSNMKASEQNESIEYWNQDVFDTKYYSPDSDQMYQLFN